MSNKSYPVEPSQCLGCRKSPKELIEYTTKQGFTPDEAVKGDGSYDPSTGLFLCTECYIKSGMHSRSEMVAAYREASLLR